MYVRVETIPPFRCLKLRQGSSRAQSLCRDVSALSPACTAKEGDLPVGLMSCLCRSL